MQEVIGRVKMTNARRFSFSLALPFACVFLKFSHDLFCCTPKISATPWAATTAGNFKKLTGLRQVKSGVFVVNLWNFSVYQSCSVQNHLPSAASISVDTRQNKHVLIGWQTWHVLPPNIWSFWSACSAHILFLSRFKHISRSETAHLPPEIILTV